MTFSIAIPVHNGAKYLKQTLESAATQIRAADEILVVDDASTDQSKEVIDEFRKQYSLRYEHNAYPTGYVDAWNRAIQWSTGEYVTILHQDDLLDPWYLELVERAFEQYPAALHLYTGYKYIDNHGKVVKQSPFPHDATPHYVAGPEYARQYLRGVAVNAHIHRCPGVTTQRSFLLHHPYRKEAGLIADDDFFIRAGKYTNVIGIGLTLASFRIHDDSATSRLESLSHELAHDYLHSIGFHNQNREFLDDEGRNIIARLASRFINQLLFDGEKNGNETWIAAALQYSVEMNSLEPRWKKLYLPLWANILWMFKERGTNAPHVARWYCKVLEMLLRMKQMSDDLFQTRQKAISKVNDGKGRHESSM